MLTIILGVVIAEMVLQTIIKRLEDNGIRRCTAVIFSIIAVIVIIEFVWIGVFVPVGGYEDWILAKETELISMSNDPAGEGKGLIYVYCSKDNVYTYRYKKDEKKGIVMPKEYETEELENKNVEIVEDPFCVIPVLQEYQREGKHSILTFALFSRETKYVFYLPQGTSFIEQVKTETDNNSIADIG